MRKKILIFSPTIITTNNYFVRSDVFGGMAEKYDIYICCNTGTKGSDLALFEKKGFKEVYPYDQSARRRRVWPLQLHVSTLGGKKLSKNCRIIYNMNKRAYGNPISRMMHRTLGFSAWTARFTNYMLEKYAGENAQIKSIMESIRPDLAITFLCGSAPLEIDSIKSCMLHKVPVLGLQNGWDNISTRGLMPFMPDYMGVWGYQSRVFAERMHNFPSNRIFHAGAPFADELKSSVAGTANAIRKKLGLPETGKVLFFAGSIWAYNEVRNLKALDEAITSGRLKDVSIFYRPHPFRHNNNSDINFFEQQFRNVYLDPSLKDTYRAALKDKRDFPFRKDGTSVDFKHIGEILSVSSAVISPISTVMIQGAFLGIPSVGIAYADDENRRYMYRCDFEEFSIMKTMPGIFLCTSDGALVDHCLEALEFSRDEAKKNMLKDYARLAMHDDEMTLGARVGQAVDAILSADKGSVYAFLNNEPEVTD